MDAEADREDNDSRPVIICGFGELGQAIANLLDSPVAAQLECGPVPYVGFDIHHERVRAARRAGFNVLYGDASRLNVRVCRCCAFAADRPAACAPVHCGAVMGVLASVQWSSSP